MPMSRNKKWDLRNFLYEIEQSIPRADRSRAAERERDLLTIASVAIWDENLPRIHRSLRRLLGSAERGEKYAKALELLAA
jgi:hypothetical protein